MIWGKGCDATMLICKSKSLFETKSNKFRYSEHGEISFQFKAPPPTSSEISHLSSKDLDSAESDKIKNSAFVFHSTYIHVCHIGVMSYEYKPTHRTYISWGNTFTMRQQFKIGKRECYIRTPTSIDYM